jgi:hypothetical protein
MYEMPVKTYRSWRAGRPWKASSGTVRMALLHRSRSCSNDRPLNRFPSRLSIWLLAKSLETKNALTGSGILSGDEPWQCVIDVQHFIDSLCLRLPRIDVIIVAFGRCNYTETGNSMLSQMVRNQDSCCLLFVLPYNVLSHVLLCSWLGIMSFVYTYGMRTQTSSHEPLMTEIETVSDTSDNIFKLT